MLVGLSRDRRCIGDGRARRSGRSGHPSRVVGRLVDHPPACCQNMVNSCSMTCRTLLLAHTRMAQPLAWSGVSLCVAYARASMPRVPRGPRRPPRHAWYRLVRPNLAAPAAASLLAIIAEPSVAAGAAGKAPGDSYYVRNAKSEKR